jgi:hypothetical protein
VTLGNTLLFHDYRLCAADQNKTGQSAVFALHFCLFYSAAYGQAYNIITLGLIWYIAYAPLSLKPTLGLGFAPALCT